MIIKRVVVCLGVCAALASPSLAEVLANWQNSSGYVEIGYNDVQADADSQSVNGGTGYVSWGYEAGVDDATCGHAYAEFEGDMTTDAQSGVVTIIADALVGITCYEAAQGDSTYCDTSAYFYLRIGVTDQSYLVDISYEFDEPTEPWARKNVHNMVIYAPAQLDPGTTYLICSGYVAYSMDNELYGYGALGLGAGTDMTITLTPVPEPCSLALLGVGGLVAMRRENRTR